MELPATFGKYQLLERIATGGMAEVFLARSFGVEGFEKRLVIKRILPQLARSPHFVSLFIQEAKISVLLNHPNIVQVFDLGRVGEDHYIAMEHIHGRDLTRTVRRLRAEGRRLPLPVAVWIAAGLARGLSYAHSRVDAEGVPLNIVHRDVSPHNVILSFEGQVKLVDFGIARLIGREEDRGAGAGGKFAYMSPEQARGEAIDHRSDIFSCAIVLYELLVDHRLFKDTDPEEKLRKVKSAIVPDVRIENPDVPVALWEVLKKALSLNPEDRWPTAAHFEEELRAFLFESGQRVEEPQLREFLADLYEDELGPDPAAAQLHDLAHELHRLESDESDQSSMGTDATVDDPLTQTPRPLGEKKSVAVVVAEVVGLTDASEIIEPEEVLQQQDHLMKAVRRTAARYMGWVDQFAMDTVTVLFGIPKAHEDDTDRALACAQDLVTAVARLRHRGQPVDLALGVHRGEVAVRHDGDRLRYVPRGNVVKMARRLAALADPSEVVVSDLVAGESGDRWRFNVGPRLRWKGSRDESPSYVLIGRRRRLGGQGGRWIRRDDELEVLAGAMGRLARGQGGVVAISGGAGTGKTRLLRELRELAGRAGVPIFMARAYPYGGDHPLAPFRDLVAAALGIDLDDDRREVENRLQRLAELGLTVEEGANIAKLFAVDATRVVTPSKEAMFAAGARFLRGIVADAPALVALEDVQYLEPQARDLLVRLIRATSSDRALWLLTWRGREPDGLPAADHRVTLKPLSDPGVRQLLRDVLAAREVSDGLLELVQTSARGNPLYAVEVSKALQRRRLIRYENRTAGLAQPGAEPLLPPTLGGLIGAQVDALDPASKGALQIAATIGLSFSAGLVAEAAGLDEPEVLLRDLVDSGLILPEGEGAYSFASHLVWQVVRRSILGVQLRDHHRLVAEGIERLHRDRLDAWAEALSGHCAACGRKVDAARYANRAGDQHRRTAFLERALACYRRGIDWLEEAEDPDANLRGEALLHLKAGEVALLIGHTRDAERHLQIALDLADGAMFLDVESRCFLALGRMYLANGKLVLAEANLDQGLATAREGDARVEFLVEQAALVCEGGDYERAEELLRDAAELAGDDEGLVARSKLGLANRYLRDDRPQVAWQLLMQARDSARDSGDRILLGRVLNNLGIARYTLDDHEGALEWFRKALEVRRGSGYSQGLVINLHNIGDSHLRLGEHGKAHAAFSEALERAREVGLERSVVLNQACLEYLAGLQGDEQAAARMDACEASARKLGDTQAALSVRLMQGRLLVRSGDERGGQMLREALDEAVSVGHAWLARDLEKELLKGGA
jgi:eukaryotic-like serine/threonine-protein kinase